MIICKKQKVALCLGLIILILNFIFPPWCELWPPGKDWQITKFVGYSFLFSPPEYYQFQYYNITEYTDTENEIINIRKKRPDMYYHDLYDIISAKIIDSSLKRQFDSLYHTPKPKEEKKPINGDNPFLKFKLSRFAAESSDQFYKMADSLFDVLFDSTKIVGHSVKKNKEIDYYPQIYIELLIIQIIMITILTTGLFIVLRQN